VDSTAGATLRAGGLFAQSLGLLFQQGGEGALGEAGGGGAGELLHGVEVGVEAGAALAEGAAGDDLAPAGSEVADFLEELGGKFATRHGRYHLVLAAKVREGLLGALYDTRLGLAKLLMASNPAFGSLGA
jgi:hypothetical protein